MRSPERRSGMGHSRTVSVRNRPLFVLLLLRFVPCLLLARPARSGKPGSGTGARFAPIATTPCASSATAPRSTVPARAGSGSGRHRPACGPRLRRRISRAAGCWTPEGSRTDSACSTICSVRLLSPRDGSSYPQFSSFGAPDRVVRLAAARVQPCKNRNHQPSPQASVTRRGTLFRSHEERSGGAESGVG